MAATMTIEAATDAPCPRAIVTVQGLEEGIQFELWRQVDGEPRQGVRGGMALRGPTVFVVDGEAPLCRPVRYDLVGPSGETIATNSVQVDSDTPWIHDPTELRTAIPVAIRNNANANTLTAASLVSWSNDVPSKAYPVIGSSIPWISAGIPQAAADLPLVIRSIGADTRLRALVETVPVLCVRTLPHMDELTATAYLITGARRATTISRHGETWREWSMTASVTRPPALSILAPVHTWQTLRDLFPAESWTWGDVRVALSGRTWLQVRRDPTP